LLDLLAKAFVVRRLRISAQYARSSLLGLRKNLLRNRRQSYCIVTAEGCGPSEFVALSNRTYSVEYQNSLEPGTWSTLMKVPARLTNRVETVTEPGGAPETRFYRLTTPALP
jgi:hypothetical protein